MQHFRPHHAQTLLLLLVLLISSSGYSQIDTEPLSFTPGWQQSSPFTADRDNLNSNSPNKNSLLSQPTQFLPVNEAYQLSAILTDPQTLQINWNIADGYYLYRHRLAFSVDQKPLTANIPDGQIKYDNYFEKELGVFYQSLSITLPLPDDLINQERSTNENTLIQVDSQGCADAGLCYPPQTQTLQIQQGTVSLLSASPNIPAAPLSNETSNTDRGSLNQLLASLLAALIGGMILNLMPCVFPILSLKALSLARAHEKPSHQHLHGWSYTLGAVLMFVAIAALMLSLRQAGQAVGWGFQLQSPAVVASLAYLFFVMGLLLAGNTGFGSSFSGSGQQLTEGHSLRASFFTGGLATIVASPCTAPFMGGALGYAITQPTSIGLLIFATLGFGMALPLLLLSYYPGLSKRLPKPGSWMQTLKQLLAFPLILTALWLLWVLGRQTSSDTVVAFAAGAVAITFALWLWRLQTPLMRGLAAFALATALLPYNNLSGQQASLSPLASSNSQQPLQHSWQPYTETRLQQLRQAGSPVFVNLSADWCITCLANEKIALNTETSLSAFEQAGIVKLKGDWTNYNPEITRLLTKFGRSGVPLYLLYPSGVDSKPEILPQLLREHTVIEAIERSKI